MSCNITYFPMPGRAEITRMCFYHGGKELKNTHSTIPDFYESQKHFKYPFNQLPVFEVEDSGYICQSGAFTRYSAKINGLYPTDALKAIYVDEIYEVVESLVVNSSFYSLPDSEKDGKRKSFLERDLVRFENFMKLRISDSPFIVNGELSLADIALHFLVKYHLVGAMIGFTIEQLKESAPVAIAYIEKLGEVESIKNIQAKSDAFYASVAQ